MVDLDRRRSHLPSAFDSPGQRIQPRIKRARSPTTFIEVHRAQPDDRTETTPPPKRMQGHRHVRIVLEPQISRPRSLLVLVDHQWPHESHTVIAKLPLVAGPVGRAGERPPAHYHQVPATLQVRA